MRKGPRYDPFGSPAMTLMIRDLKPCTLTICDGYVKYVSSQRNNGSPRTLPVKARTFSLIDLPPLKTSYSVRI